MMTTPEYSYKKKKELALHWQILIGLALALLIGFIMPANAQIGGVKIVDIFQFFGQLFLRALQMVVVPLVLSSVVTAIARLGEEHAFGRMGIKTLFYYVSTITIAILVGLLFVNLMAPGKVDTHTSQLLISSAKAETQAIATKVEGHGLSEIFSVFQRMIPTNIFAVFADNREMLSLIFFSILFGYFMTKLDADRRARFIGFWDDLYEVMIITTNWILRFAPYGVFALIAKIVMTTGLEAAAPLVKFFFCVIIALSVHTFIILPFILLCFGISPIKHFRGMTPTLLTAFSTASSLASVPVSMECLQKSARIPRRISSFVIPLGATVNMNGTALYECVAAIFIAQIYGINLTFDKQVMIVVLALLTSVGVAGIPAASLVAIVVILGVIGLPLEAIGIIIVTDRILDMCRTAVNIFGDTCGAVVIAKTEGLQPYEYYNEELEEASLEEKPDIKASI